MSYDFTRLLGPSTDSAQGTLATVVASGVLYVRCHAGSAVEKLDWLLQGNRSHTYQYYRAHQLPGTLSTLTLSGLLNTETFFIMGSTYTGATSTTTWSTGGISIATSMDACAALLVKAINGGRVVTCTTADASNDTVVVDGVTFTGGAAESLATRVWHADSANATTAATSLAACINDSTYGVSGVTATLGAGTGEVLIAYTSVYDTYPTVTSSNGTRLAVSTIGQTYISATKTGTAIVSIKWRDSLVDRNGFLAPSFFTAKTGTATTHAAFADTLLTQLEEDGAVSSSVTDNSASAGAIHTHTLNGAEDGYLRVTNSDAGNAMITRVAAYRIPWS